MKNYLKVASKRRKNLHQGISLKGAFEQIDAMFSRDKKLTRRTKGNVKQENRKIRKTF